MGIGGGRGAQDGGLEGSLDGDVTVWFSGGATPSLEEEKSVSELTRGASGPGLGSLRGSSQC